MMRWVTRWTVHIQPAMGMMEIVILRTIRERTSRLDRGFRAKKWRKEKDADWFSLSNVRCWNSIERLMAFAVGIALPIGILGISLRNGSSSEGPLSAQGSTTEDCR